MNRKKLFFSILILFFIFGNAQTPISESNSFLYNKQNYGVEIFNAWRYIYQDDNGVVVTWPYNKPYLEITSTHAKQYLKNNKLIGPLQQIFKIKNKTYLFSTDGILQIMRGGNVKNVIQYNILNFYNIYFDENLWFVDVNRENNEVSVCFFDGQNVKKLKNIPNFNLNALKFGIGFYIYKKTLYLFASNPNNKQTDIYLVEKNGLKFFKSFPFYCNNLFFKNENEILFIDWSDFHVKQYSNGIIKTIFKTPKGNRFLDIENNVCVLDNENFLNIMCFHDGKPKILANIFNVPLFATSLYNKESNSYYLGTGNGFFRLFPYIKKYPRIFNNMNSQNIFSLVQGNDGKIWAGSYNSKLVFIDNTRITKSPLKYSYMNAGLKVGNKIILGTEAEDGILLFEDENKYRKIHNTALAYRNYLSKDSILYSGISNSGLMFGKWKDVLIGSPNWTIIGKEQGNPFIGFDAIIEDKFGNILASKFNKGFLALNPKTGKFKTWEISKNQVAFGSLCMFEDSYENLWIGGNNGKLYHYVSKNQGSLSPNNFKEIQHPLFECERTITFMNQWRNYLILGAEDKILLFDLVKWYENNEVNVRYLNPLETCFTSNTEQNTILTDFRDESIWFSTSDMLYQWDIKNWLKLPTFKVLPELIFKKNSTDIFLKENDNIKFKPSENSIDIEIRYQSKDNMPRYISAVLVKERDKPKFNPPNLETHYKFQNLNHENYIFYVRICQQDGSYSIHAFNIEVKKFLWQHWWFWLLISLLPIIFIYIYYRSKREIEIKKKVIAQLNVSTLSNQFRPHFMLNALNSLGTELDDKPHAEKVISRIGENINLMYDYSQEKKFYIPFKNEWKLVENTIEIQKIIFIKELKVQIRNLEIIPDNYQIPMGIMQVCVENALLHGIRHLKKPPYLLEINFSEISNYYIVQIIDNGIGREKSNKIYNFKRKGSGLKNIYSLINIVNNEMEDAIKLEIEDANFSINNINPGTKITIYLMKKINYEQFNL